MNARVAAVFVSYASADAEAARRIADALRAHGVEVWLDESELRGGDAWDASIRKQIRECALFVPLISASTNARSEGYFRLEWRLAIERSRLIADDRPFLLPVVVDGTLEAGARVPEAFLERQWSRLTDAHALAEFGAHVKRLLDAPATAARQKAPVVSTPRRSRNAWVAFAALGILILAGALFWRQRAAAPPASAAAAPEQAGPSPKAIAVLPFDNLSGRDEDAYLADGLQQEILNALARVRDLTVISRTSTLEYRGKARNVREIGQRLGVGSVLEGSIRRDGSQLRLTVQLVDSHDDRQIFAANYDRDLAHVLDLQSKVARQVAAALSATLTQYERGELDRVATNSGDAYDRYLRALALFRQDTPEDESGLVEPKRLLDEALRLDPDFADAWALLSQAHGWSYFDAPVPEEAAAAKAAFERAFALDPELPEARLARGIYELYASKDFDRAIVDFDAFAKLRPSSGTAESMLGYALRRQAKFEEALPHFDRAWVLDPLNLAYAGGRVTTLLGLRRYPEAIQRILAFQARFPARPAGTFVRARLEAQMRGGDIEPLRAALHEHGSTLGSAERKSVEAEIARAEGRYLDAIALWSEVPVDEAMMRDEKIGGLYWAAADTGKAEEAFRTLEREATESLKQTPDNSMVLTYLGIAQSMLGKHAQAISTLDRARELQPEAQDPVNGPHVSFVRSILLLHAGRTAEAYAEVDRLLRVPFGAPIDFFDDTMGVVLLAKGDPHFEQLIHHPPRL